MVTVAAVLAALIGGLSIAAGSMAIRGWNPGYNVLSWLPFYNFFMGIFTIMVPTILIWRRSTFAMPASLLFCAIHALVTILLIIVFRETAAIQSMLAMLFRVIVWFGIITLLYFSTK